MLRDSALPVVSEAVAVAVHLQNVDAGEGRSSSAPVRGGRLQCAASTLNGEGIASPAGKLWSKNGIHFILRNEVYTGTFTLRFVLDM